MHLHIFSLSITIHYTDNTLCTHNMHSSFPFQFYFAYHIDTFIIHIFTFAFSIHISITFSFLHTYLPSYPFLLPFLFHAYFSPFTLYFTFLILSTYTYHMISHTLSYSFHTSSIYHFDMHIVTYTIIMLFSHLPFLCVRHM